MKITAMLDILCFLLAMLAIACFWDFLVTDKWFFLVFVFIFIDLIIWAQVGKVKLKQKRRVK